MSTSRPRGRPRLYDKETALTTMQRIFWENGFSATSLDQISAETGINRPSLYAAFGSKKDMYIKCLQHFAEMMGKRTENAILSEPDLSKGLEKVFMQAMEIYRPEAPWKTVARSAALSPAPLQQRLVQMRRSGKS